MLKKLQTMVNKNEVVQPCTTRWISCAEHLFIMEIMQSHEIKSLRTEVLQRESQVLSICHIRKLSFRKIVLNVQC